MNILKTLSLILLTTILTACDNGTITKNKECGMAQGEERIEGYNTEICDKDKEIKLLVMLFGSIIEDALPEKHSASQIKNNIENDESEKITKDENNKVFGYIGEGIIIIVLILGVVGIIAGAGILLVSKSVDEKVDYNTEKARYIVPIAIGIVFIGALVSLRYTENYTVGQRLAALPIFVWSKMLFNNINSIYIATSQTGDMLTDNTSENVILDSAAAFKANAITTSINKGVLSDLRTAKYTFEKNLERKVEHNEPLKITILEDAIYIDRYKDNKILNKLVKIEFHKQTLSNAFASKAYNDALDANITSELNQIEAKAASFKRAFMSSTGYDLTDSRINMATQSFITETFKLALYNKVEEMLPKHYEVMRVVEETKCYDGKKQSDNKSITYTANQYIKYLKGETSEPMGSNACISEPKKGQFFAMGNKSKVDLGLEEIKLNEAIFKEYYKIYREYEVILSKATIDSANAIYCKKARQEGYVAAILYDRYCRESNFENRKLMNTLAASHTIKDYARNSFVQTEFTKNDMSRSPLLNHNFDSDIQRLSLQIGIDATKAILANKSEAIDFLVNSNTEYTSDDGMQIFLDPMKTLKNKVGITDKNCQLDFSACVDSEKFMSAMNHYADDLINIGVYPFAIGVSGSAALGRQEKADDKSNAGDLEYGKNSTTKKQKNKAGAKLEMVKTVFAALKGIGGFMILAGLYAKVVVNFVQLFFTMAMVIYTCFTIIAYVMYPLRFLWMLYANDANNIKSNALKIVGEWIFYMIVPAFIFSSYLVAKTISFYVISSVATELLSDTGGFIELIAMSMIILPVIHIMILFTIRNFFIDPMRILSESLNGDSKSIDAINEILSKAISILSFGANLSFVYSMTKRRS
jgi:hypothetical protein